MLTSHWQELELVPGCRIVTASSSGMLKTENKFHYVVLSTIVCSKKRIFLLISIEVSSLNWPCALQPLCRQLHELVECRNCSVSALVDNCLLTAISVRDNGSAARAYPVNE